jgi:hypothetical protein
MQELLKQYETNFGEAAIRKHHDEIQETDTASTAKNALREALEAQRSITALKAILPELLARVTAGL